MKRCDFVNLSIDSSYIYHILDAIKDIEESIDKLTKSQFLKDKDRKDANVRRLEIIGEAVKNISNKTKNEYKNIEWSKIAGTRDKMVHHYFGVDFEIVWNIITIDIPILKEVIIQIKKELEH